MKSKEEPSSSAEREAIGKANRQVLACIGIFSLASCLLILVTGALGWLLAPRVIPSITAFLARSFAGGNQPMVAEPPANVL